MSIPSQQKKIAKQTAKLLSPLMVQKSCPSWDCYFIPLGGFSTSHVVGRISSINDVVKLVVFCQPSEKSKFSPQKSKKIFSKMFRGEQNPPASNDFHEILTLIRFFQRNDTPSGSHISSSNLNETRSKLYYQPKQGSIFQWSPWKLHYICIVWFSPNG